MELERKGTLYASILKPIGLPSKLEGESDLESKARWSDPWSGYILSLIFGHGHICIAILFIPPILKGCC